MANKISSATKVVIPCRISFANIFEAKSINGGEAKFSVSCLIDHTFYPVVYGLTDEDDWHDETNWYKANPSLGQTIKIERVRDAYQEALDNPAEENVFKQLRLNMWVASLTRFIPEHIYNLGNQPIDMEALKGRDCYGGLDLPSTGDITAFVLMFPPRIPEEKYIMLPFF